MRKGLRCLMTAALAFAATSAYALDDPDKAYLRRFTITEPFTAIIEYVDDTGQNIVGQRTFASATSFTSTPTAGISLTGITLNLYGLQVCQSSEPIQVYIYHGPCNGAAQQYMDQEMEQSPIIICRVFMKYAKEQHQDATCWTLYTVADIAIVHNFEDALVRVGAVTLARDDKGNALRPDLEDAEQYAKDKESLLWNPNAASVANLPR